MPLTLEKRLVLCLVTLGLALSLPVHAAPPAIPFSDPAGLTAWLKEQGYEQKTEYQLRDAYTDIFTIAPDAWKTRVTVTSRRDDGKPYEVAVTVEYVGVADKIDWRSKDDFFIQIATKTSPKAATVLGEWVRKNIGAGKSATTVARVYGVQAHVDSLPKSRTLKITASGG